MLVEPITRRFDRQGVRLGRPERPFRELAVQVLLVDQQLALVVAAPVGIHRAPVPDVFARPPAYGPVVEAKADVFTPLCFYVGVFPPPSTLPIYPNIYKLIFR